MATATHPKAKDYPLADIIIEDRYRKEHGDLEALAASIDQTGLLQPIVVDSNGRLIVGERRYRAFKLLGRDTIPALVMDVDDPLYAEYAENEFRKEFTISERVAMAQAIEEQMGDRRGRHKQEDGGETDETIGRPTAAIAAEHGGFGNRMTYEQAKKVVNKGSAELIEALNEGTIKINAAYLLVDLPKSKQNEIVREGAAAIREAVSAARKDKAAAVSEDDPHPLHKIAFKPLDKAWTILTEAQAEMKKRRWKLESRFWNPRDTKEAIEVLEQLQEQLGNWLETLQGREDKDAAAVAKMLEEEEAERKAKEEAKEKAREEKEAAKAKAKAEKAEARKKAKAEAKAQDNEEDEEDEEDEDDYEDESSDYDDEDEE